MKRQALALYREHQSILIMLLGFPILAFILPIDVFAMAVISIAFGLFMAILFLSETYKSTLVDLRLVKRKIAARRTRRTDDHDDGYLTSAALPITAADLTLTSRSAIMYADETW